MLPPDVFSKHAFWGTHGPAKKLFVLKKLGQLFCTNELQFLDDRLLQSPSWLFMLTSAELLSGLAAQYGTPLYLLDVQKILGAMNTLRDGLSIHYPNSEITYSVKTNYLSHILRQVLSHGNRLEVVSRHEMMLAQENGAQPNQLLLNGPVKSLEDLIYCYQHSIDLNLDSVDELQAATTIGTLDKPFRLGLRAAATLKNGNISRFGIDFGDSDAVSQIRKLIQNPCIDVIGLHTHHSSRRDAQSYCDRIDHLSKIAKLLEIKPEYLDIGGGVGSTPPPEIAAQLTYPIDDPKQLATIIGKHAFEKWGSQGPRIILEPGIAVLAESMNYLTRIVSVKNRGTGQIAVCDGSLFDVNPLRSTVHPPCHLLTAHDDPSEPSSESTRLYGGTCMEIDQIGTLPAGRTPRPGDLVHVSNVGAYSACLAPQFIIPPAPIYSVDLNKIIRQRPTLGNFIGAGK
jgi:diaminopimelate decarboxylase